MSHYQYFTLDFRLKRHYVDAVNWYANIAYNFKPLTFVKCLFIFLSKYHEQNIDSRV